MPSPVITINNQPLSALIAIGSAASFSVFASSSSITDILIYQWLKDGKEITGATASTFTIASVISEDSNVYSCVVTSTEGGNSLTSNRVVLSSSIIDNIELQMKVLMLGMTNAGGYNFNWSSVNEEDQAIGDYPRALMESPIENCIDDPVGGSQTSYTNEVLFIVWVTGLQFIDSNPNPNFTIRSNLRLAEDDLKRLFGINYQLNGSADNIMFRGAQIFKGDNNDVQKPATMKTQWRVSYSQDRISPRLYAGS
jgi:hypothetical protein